MVLLLYNSFGFEGLGLNTYYSAFDDVRTNCNAWTIRVLTEILQSPQKRI